MKFSFSGEGSDVFFAWSPTGEIRLIHAQEVAGNALDALASDFLGEKDKWHPGRDFPGLEVKMIYTSISQCQGEGILSTSTHVLWKVSTFREDVSPKNQLYGAEIFEMSNLPPIQGVADGWKIALGVVNGARGERVVLRRSKTKGRNEAFLVYDASTFPQNVEALAEDISSVEADSHQISTEADHFGGIDNFDLLYIGDSRPKINCQAFFHPHRPIRPINNRRDGLTSYASRLGLVPFRAPFHPFNEHLGSKAEELLYGVVEFGRVRWACRPQDVLGPVPGFNWDPEHGIHWRISGDDDRVIYRKFDQESGFHADSSGILSLDLANKYLERGIESQIQWQETCARERRERLEAFQEFCGQHVDLPVEIDKSELGSSDSIDLEWNTTIGELVDSPWWEILFDRIDFQEAIRKAVECAHG